MRSFLKNIPLLSYQLNGTLSHFKTIDIIIDTSLNHTCSAKDYAKHKKCDHHHMNANHIISESHKYFGHCQIQLIDDSRSKHIYERILKYTFVDSDMVLVLRTDAILTTTFGPKVTAPHEHIPNLAHFCNNMFQTFYLISGNLPTFNLEKYPCAFYNKDWDYGFLICKQAMIGFHQFINNAYAKFSPAKKREECNNVWPQCDQNISPPVYDFFPKCNNFCQKNDFDEINCATFAHMYPYRFHTLDKYNVFLKLAK